VEPKTFDYRDIYQRIEIRNDESDYGDFYAKSVAPDYFPPGFLRRKYWQITYTSPVSYQLEDAPGLNSSLRMSIPEFDFPVSNKRSPPINIGEWYSPFIFIKEEGSVKIQKKKALFYKVTLEQYWEEIHSQENHGGAGNIVTVNTNVEREVYGLAGVKAVKDNGSANGVDGCIWFRVHNQKTGGVGLSPAVLDRMRWIQKEGGWVDGEDSSERVERVEEIKSDGGWRRFGCFVLVESFVFRRMDRSLVLNCDFRHTQWIKCKWD
jgi:hypothetical protein